MRLLLTGAAGMIGHALTEGLAGLGHRLRGLDLREPPQTTPYDLGWVTGSCLDPDTVDAAVGDVDAVVHLAGNPDEASLPESLESHVHSTGHILDAMVGHGVARIAYASSNHAVGHTPRTDLLATTTRPRPDTFYGAAKVAAEAVLSLYADRYDISAVAMRIGTFAQRPSSRRDLETWLSPGDCVRMVHAAVTNAPPGFHPIYGISANTDAWWDLEPGRQIGYEPCDDAADFTGDVAPRPGDDAERAYVGGSFVTDLHGPAFR